MVPGAVEVETRMNRRRICPLHPDITTESEERIFLRLFTSRFNVCGFVTGRHEVRKNIVRAKISGLRVPSSLTVIPEFTPSRRDPKVLRKRKRA